MADSFVASLRKVAAQLYPGEALRIAEVVKELVKDPSITVKNGVMTIDAPKAKFKLIGVALAKPGWFDE